MGKSKQPAGGPPPVVLALVTDQFRCQRLITAGRMLADRIATRRPLSSCSRPAGNTTPL